MPWFASRFLLSIFKGPFLFCTTAALGTFDRWAGPFFSSPIATLIGLFFISSFLLGIWAAKIGCFLGLREVARLPLRSHWAQRPFNQPIRHFYNNAWWGLMPPLSVIVCQIEWRFLCGARIGVDFGDEVDSCNNICDFVRRNLNGTLWVEQPRLGHLSRAWGIFGFGFGRSNAIRRSVFIRVSKS